MLCKNSFSKIFKRSISRRQKIKAKYEHLSSSYKPITPSDVATEYFDSVYGAYYGDSWPSIRLALKSQPKYSILYNNYSHNLDSINKLQNESDGTLKNMWDLINLSSKGFDLSKYDNEDLTKESFEPFSKENDTKTCNSELSAELALKTELNKAKMNKEEKISRLLDYSHVPTSELVDFGAERLASEYNPIHSDFQPPSVPLGIYEEKKFYIPKNISFYLHDPGVFTTFPASTMTNKGLLEYYIMDASSIMPVIALDIKPENTILDMCAAPGGKSLAAIQTLNFGSITCVEKSLSRFRRMENVFDIYLPKSSKFRNRIHTLNADVCLQTQFRNSFDRIILDVPCTSDRKSMKDDDNNLFQKSRFRERTTLPTLQIELLANGIKNLKPGGFLVYSTCSLSPASNDAIIQSTYSQLIRTEPHIKFRVRNCQTLCQLFSPIFNFFQPGGRNSSKTNPHGLDEWLPPYNEHRRDSNQLIYGHTIIPSLPRNWGPLYFCKIERLA